MPTFKGVKNLKLLDFKDLAIIRKKLTCTIKVPGIKYNIQITLIKSIEDFFKTIDIKATQIYI